MGSRTAALVLPRISPASAQTSYISRGEISSAEAIALQTSDRLIASGRAA